MADFELKNKQLNIVINDCTILIDAVQQGCFDDVDLLCLMESCIDSMKHYYFDPCFINRIALLQQEISEYLVKCTKDK